MLKTAKTFAALVILVCLFLPISQCAKKGLIELDPETEGIVKIHSDQVQEKIIFNSVFTETENVESILGDVVLLVSFLLPLLFSLTPKFSGYRAVVKRCFQSLFSIWLIYLTYNLVFVFVSPLPAGWLLLASSGLFFIVINLEWFQRKT
jgi:hypothetical protein